MQSTNNFFPIANNNTHYSAFDPDFTFASQSFPNPNPLLPLPGPSSIKQTTLFDLAWLPVNTLAAPTPNPFIFPPEHSISYVPHGFLPLHGPMLPHQSKQLATPTETLKNPEDLDLSRSSVSHNVRNPTKKNLREWERHQKLKNDEYVLSFTAIHVTCAGCLKEIKLDSRDGARFYPGFWQRHKRRCQGVKDRMNPDRCSVSQ